ncbi:MAG: (2Fe-2S)-binding protein [Oscillospiraceae bacterium]|nr:(2Fe-2S)-binding protein [Oscillospiraceae bacterium]
MDGKDIIICRCEEVTRADVLRAIEAGCHTVASVKRATRAGMGACQGRTCGRLIQQILISQGVLDPASIQGDKARFPTVPCEIQALGGSLE